MADCCGRPSKTRSHVLWVILIVLSLMLAAKALWGQEAPLHPNSGRPGACPSGTSETKAITGDVSHFHPKQGPGGRFLQHRQQGRPLETGTRIPRSFFPIANLSETS